MFSTIIKTGGLDEARKDQMGPAPAPGRGTSYMCNATSGEPAELQ
jgi:hypothetical protein